MSVPDDSVPEDSAPEDSALSPLSGVVPSTVSAAVISAAGGSASLTGAASAAVSVSAMVVVTAGATCGAAAVVTVSAGAGGGGVGAVTTGCTSQAARITVASPTDRKRNFGTMNVRTIRNDRMNKPGSGWKLRQRTLDQPCRCWQTTYRPARRRCRISRCRAMSSCFCRPTCLHQPARVPVTLCRLTPRVV